MRITAALFLVAVAAAAPVSAQQGSEPCNQAAPDAITHVLIAGRPVDPVPTRDGCWIFVSTNGDQAHDGVTVLRRSGGRITQSRFVRIAGAPFGMVLTHDQKLLIVAATTNVAFLDVERLESGKGNPLLGTITNAEFKGTLLVNVTLDDSFLFVSQENSRSISVIDLKRARSAGFNARAIVGTIPTGDAPISMEFSNDEKLLYVTSQNAPPSFSWANTCIQPQRPSMPPSHPDGAVLVIDVAKAVTKPGSSVISGVRAGCNPVRLALSPDGATAYVSARTDNMLLAFDTKRMVTDTAHALIARIPVGTAPVGVAVVDSGARIVVTNSNRFEGAASANQDVTVVDATRLAAGAGAVLGSIPAGQFPRQLHVTADGNTLLLTNFTSGSLELIDVKRLDSVIKRGH